MPNDRFWDLFVENFRNSTMANSLRLPVWVKFRPRTHIEVGEQIRQPQAPLLQQEQQTQLHQVRMRRAPYETRLRVGDCKISTNQN